MLNKLKQNMGLTLIETLVAMLILSVSAAGVIGSFSYAFKYVERGGKKIEALNLGRMAMERYRAIWLVDPNNPELNETIDVSSGQIISKKVTADVLPPGYIYGGDIYLTIHKETVLQSAAPIKQIDVKVEW